VETSRLVFPVEVKALNFFLGFKNTAAGTIDKRLKIVFLGIWTKTTNLKKFLQVYQKALSNICSNKKHNLRGEGGRQSKLRKYSENLSEYRKNFRAGFST